MTLTNEWTTLAVDERGRPGSPGTSYTIKTATVEGRKGRFRLVIADSHGHHQGWHEEHGNDNRQYRASSLDELMRIALGAEQERDKPDQTIMTAIREAIYRAEDYLSNEEED